MGLPQSSNFTLNLVSEKKLIVQFDVVGLTLPGKGNFPAVISLRQTNTYNPNRHGPIAVLTFSNPGGSVRVPAYSFYIPGLTDLGNGTMFRGLERFGDFPCRGYGFGYPANKFP
jgi:hypothetical protein